MTFPNGKPALDQQGACITVDQITGILRIDGVPVCKVVLVRGEGIRLQFQDGDRLRSAGRGTRYIEIPLESIIRRIQDLCE